MDNPGWDDPSRWEVVPRVVAFAEHERTVTLPSGKTRTVKVTKKDLQETADNLNERDAKGQPSPLTIGHTDPDGSEKDQPEIVGYARKWLVEWSKKLKKWVNVCTWYLRRDRVKKAKEYPRVSPEYWPGAKIIDPLALLIRTPQLDLGQWTFANGCEVIRYALDLGTWTYCLRPDGQEVIRYAMGDWTMPDDEKPEERDDETEAGSGTPASDPTSTVPGEQEEEIDPKFRKDVMRCIKEGHPWIEEETAKRAAAAAQPAGGAMPNAAGAPAFPGATNMAGHASTAAAGSGTPESEQYRRQSAEEALRYRKLEERLAATEKEMAASRQQNADLARHNRDLARRADLKRLEDAGVVLDVEQELADAVALSDAAWKVQYAKMAKNYRSDPTKPAAMFTVAPSSESEPAGVKDEAELDRVWQYIRDEETRDPTKRGKISQADALAAVRRPRK